MRASKGSAFEREISKALSVWWSTGLGLPADDAIFWRSSQSGGRATQRAKSGKKTFGSYGDIAAVNPIGQPLIAMFTIELKRGNSHGCPFELVECASSNCIRNWEAAIQQAIEASNNAGSKSWLLIHKKDRKVPMVYFSSHLFPKTFDLNHAFPMVRFRLAMNTAKGQEKIYLTGMPLEIFLNLLKPKQIMELVK